MSHSISLAGVPVGGADRTGYQVLRDVAFCPSSSSIISLLLQRREGNEHKGASSAFKTKKIFPEYLAKGVHPGVFAVPKEGDLHYSIMGEGFFCPKLMEETAAIFNRKVHMKRPSFFETNEKMGLVLGMMGAGIGVSVKLNGRAQSSSSSEAKGIAIKQLYYWNTNAKYPAQKAALTYLEKTVLQDPSFFKNCPAEIVKAILKTHELIIPGAFASIAGGLGQFRNHFRVCLFGGEIGTDEAFENMLKKLEEGKVSTGNEKQLHTCYSSLMDQPGLTLKQLNLLSKIAHIPVGPKTAEKAMHSFFRRLKDRVNILEKRGRGDVIELAGWVHSEIMRIYPFVDGNGRVARAWMNTLLQKFGVDGVVFPNAKEYEEAVERGLKSPEEFVLFLRQIVAWNRRTIQPDA